MLLAERQPAAPPPTPPTVAGLDDLPPLVPLWPEAARLLGCSRNRAYELARLGVIPTLRLGKRTYVRRADLER
ncbi:MAG: helix-turn-helix domain-containing protein, partial [Chloroflexi bacterium]|nr:helix-turn-helix domain-containing protein [Chloroflexota bacterium]